MGIGTVDGVAKDRKPKDVQELDELVIIGNVQKPSVYLIIGRGDIKPDEFTTERDFVRELEDTVKGKPF